MGAEVIVVANDRKELKKMTSALDFLAAAHGGKPAFFQSRKKPERSFGFENTAQAIGFRDALLDAAERQETSMAIFTLGGGISRRISGSRSPG